MPMLDALRKGFQLLLLSFGISSPASSTTKKPRPAPAPKPDDSK